ncbi:MAG: hypothetical protein ABEJ87_02960 [Candidatus Nanohalobium sp.]
MGIVEKLKDKLGSQAENIEISWRDAPELFSQKKSRDLETAKRREKDFRETTEEIRKEIAEGLEAFNDYEDSKRLKVVKDVAQNFYRSRKRLVEDFDPSEDTEEHLEDLHNFVEDFNDVSRKEGEVMRYVHKDAPELSNALDRLVKHEEKMEDFVETQYQVVVQLEMVKDYVNEIEEADEDLEEAEKALEGKDTRSIKADLESTEKEIEKVEDTDEWQHMKSLEKEKKELEKKRKRRKAEIREEASKMERGLKKLIYNIENEGLTFEGRLNMLKKLKDEDIEELSDPSDEVREAIKRIRQEDFLGERQEKKFVDAAKYFEEFEQHMDGIEELSGELEDVEERLEEIEIDERKDELKQKKQRLENDLMEKKDTVRDLEEKRNRKQDRKQKKMIELEHFLNSLLRDQVSIEEVNRQRTE